MSDADDEVYKRIELWEEDARVPRAVRPLPIAERERLGRLVRDVWVAWAREQPNPKASWLVPWEGLSEPDREVDRRIGERLWREGRGAR